MRSPSIPQLDLGQGPARPDIEDRRRHAHRIGTRAHYSAVRDQACTGSPAHLYRRRLVGAAAPLPDHDRGSHGPQCPCTIKAPGEQIHDALAPELQPRIQHVEGGDGHDVGVDRSRGRRAGRSTPLPRPRRAIARRPPRRAADVLSPAAELLRPAPAAAVGALSAAANSSAVANRSAGSFAIARVIARSTAGGTVCLTVCSEGTGSTACRARICCAVRPVNGGWPASIS